MTSAEVLNTAERAYQLAQAAGFEWTVAQAERRADRDSLHAVYLARWLVYVRLVQWGVTIVCAEHGSREAVAA